MASARYYFLQKRVTSLRGSLLPRKFSPTGLYSDRIHQRAAAFRLFVHAEFESYLEDAVLDLVSARLKAWKTNRIPSITLATLLAYDQTDGKTPASLLNPPAQPGKFFDERLADSVTRFNRQVRVTNHGVREANVLAMLLPVGLDASSIDIAWLADLDSWAQERGELAHTSSGKVGLKLDPARELTKARLLLGGLKRIDEAIAALP